MTYVDISSNNGTPDLAAYWRAGYTDLMLKATEGTGYAWSAMQGLAREWHAKGGRVGYYHWLYGTQSAQAQHDFFWGQVAPVFKPGDWLMTDFEDVDPSRRVSDATYRAVLSQFNALCARHSRVDTYTGNWYLSDKPATRAYLKTQTVVMSDYSNNPPANPYGLTYIAHQFTSSATVPGFSSPVDCNRWVGAQTEVETATPLKPSKPATEAEEMTQQTLYQVVSGPNTGYQYLATATTKAVWISPVDKTTEIAMGHVANPTKPVPVVQLQIDNHNRFIAKLGA